DALRVEVGLVLSRKIAFQSNHSFQDFICRCLMYTTRLICARVHARNMAARRNELYLPIEPAYFDPRVVDGTVFSVDLTPLFPDVFAAIAAPRIENCKTITGVFAVFHDELLEPKSLSLVSDRDQIGSANQIDRLEPTDEIQTEIQVGLRVSVEYHHI